MQLLILLIIAGVIGYLLVGSQYGKNIDQTTEKVSETSEGLINRFRHWWKARFGKKEDANRLVAWASGSGAAVLPEEFRLWLKSLSHQEADQFASALAEHSHSLGFELDELVSGGYDQKPAMMQVYVEAVAVYSNEYRKAKQAQAEAKSAEEGHTVKVEEPGGSSSDDKAVAEKQPSRRRGAMGDAAEPSAAA
jgi:hypothetical protein